jgi:hypothetical protein
MDEVLAELVARDKSEAEDAQRALVAATCGLAALALLRGAPQRAVARYREVLAAAAEREGVCDVDRLQRIHAMSNLGAPAPPPSHVCCPHSVHRPSA